LIGANNTIVMMAGALQYDLAVSGAYNMQRNPQI
jgi:hypothetical protein